MTECKIWLYQTPDDIGMQPPSVVMFCHAHNEILANLSMADEQEYARNVKEAVDKHVRSDDEENPSGSHQ